MPIRDLTQLVVSVDQGGSVTFVNELRDRTVEVGGAVLPALVDVTARTQVTLTVPSGRKALAPGAALTETFDRSCVAGCWLTFTYTYESGAALTQPLLDAAAALLPPLPRPQPLVVNTLLPLPDLAGANLPPLPPLALPEAPQGTPPPPTDPAAPAPPPTGQAPSPEVAPAPSPQDVPGRRYTYDTAAGVPRSSPRAPARPPRPSTRPAPSSPARLPAAPTAPAARTAPVPVASRAPATVPRSRCSASSPVWAPPGRTGRRPTRSPPCRGPTRSPCRRPRSPPSSRWPPSPRRSSAPHRQRARPADRQASPRRPSSSPAAAPGGRIRSAGSLKPRVPAPAGARDACTTLLLQIPCSR